MEQQSNTNVHIINCDAAPFLPDNYEVIEHKHGGQLEWSPTQMKLYLSFGQRHGRKSVVGHKLRKKLAKQPVLNACVLDYLFHNPDLIPEEWKGECIYFWGTIYLDSIGYLCVLCLYWSNDLGLWYWNYKWLDSDFRDWDPAAVLVV
jgi:hypothetical protein